jgi:D-alanyl-D-alanine carboxypeptidase/D-alanyl-D-alanine-endopeptidase (penicillin-binding protein 4)
VAKLVTVATAADAVGWDYRYTTTVRAAGPIVEGVLRGDLLVSGTGDPSIGGRAGDDLSSWVNALKAAGIRRIEGRIIGDDDAIEEPRPQLAWAWDDLGYMTGALFGALNLAENRTTIAIAPGTSAGVPAIITVDPRLAFRVVSNRVTTGTPGSPQLVWPEQRPGELSLTVAGTIPAGAPPASLAIAVGNPTLWFASALKGRLVRDGIDVTGEAVDVDDVVPAVAREAMTVVYTHQSRPISEIAQPVLKDSINLYAEALMRLNAAPGAFPTNDAALDGLRKRLDSWGIWLRPLAARRDLAGGTARRARAHGGSLRQIALRHGPADCRSRWIALRTDEGNARRTERPGKDRHDVEHPYASRLRHDARR